MRIQTFVFERTLMALCLATIVGGRAARADGSESYTIEQHGADVTPGSPGKVTLTVIGKNGWHVNAEAPITVALVADPGIVLSKSRLTRADLAESSLEKARFDIGFTSASAGTRKISADTRFVMCQEQACKPARETVTMQVAAADPGPPGSEARAPGKATGKAGKRSDRKPASGPGDARR